MSTLRFIKLVILAYVVWNAIPVVFDFVLLFSSWLWSFSFEDYANNILENPADNWGKLAIFFILIIFAKQFLWLAINGKAAINFLEVQTYEDCVKSENFCEESLKSAKKAIEFRNKYFKKANHD